MESDQEGVHTENEQAGADEWAMPDTHLMYQADMDNWWHD